MKIAAESRGSALGQLNACSAMTEEFCAPADRGEWFSANGLVISSSISDGIAGDFFIRGHDRDADCY